MIPNAEIPCTHFGDCEWNAKAGLEVRQFNAAKFPDKKIFEEFKRWFNHLILPDLVKRIRDNLEQYTRDDFIKDTHRRKKKVYARTLREYSKACTNKACYGLLVK